MSSDGAGAVEEVTEATIDLNYPYNLAKKAIKAYHDGDYLTAIKRFTKVIIRENKRIPELLLKRAECFLKIEHHAEALTDVNFILEANPNHLQALSLKGRVHFACQQVDRAKEAFAQLKSLTENEPDTFSTSEWIRLCDEKQKKIVEEELRQQVPEPTLKESDKTETEEMATAAAAPATPEPPKIPEKIRHEWYQTDSAVIVSVMVKGLSKEMVSVETLPRKLTVNITVTEEEKRTITLDLAHPVSAHQTGFRVTPSKIEVNLRKIEGLRWEKLEASAEEVKAAEEAAKPPPRPSYPTSSKHHRDWDAIERNVLEEESQEKLEGDAALQKVFADIYANASDETKKAMNKSYVESCGTVLSTNWDEVRMRRTEIKPPDSMEFKEWDE